MIEAFAAPAITVAEYVQGCDPLFLILLICGIGLFVVEMFTPGLGFSGFAGVACLVGAVVVRANTLEEGLITFGLVLIIVIVFALIFFRSFTKGAISRSAIMLDEKIDSVSTSLSGDDAKQLVGCTGIAVTELRPTGYAEIEGKRYNVMTSGDFVEKGAIVAVTEVEGLKLSVKRVSDAQKDSND